MMIQNITSKIGSNIGSQAGVYGKSIGQDDSVSQNIQKQIANIQKQLQALSENENLSEEEKMTRRKDLNAQIEELNRQLSMHQMEQQREKQEQSSSPKDDMLSGSKDDDIYENGIATAKIQAIISGDIAIKRTSMQGSVATKLEGQQGVLEGEIKLDQSRGANTIKKEKALADLEKQSANVRNDQMGALAGISKSVEQASNKEEVKDTDTDKKDKVQSIDGGRTVDESAKTNISAGTITVITDENEVSISATSAITYRLDIKV